MDFDQNAPYLYAAYAVFIIGVVVYLISLVLRQRTLRRDEAMLQEIEAEERPTDDGQPTTA